MSSRKRKRQIDQDVEQGKEKRLREFIDKFGPEDYEAYTPEASWDMILDNPDAPWDWEYLSLKTDLKTIVVHSNLPWNWEIVSVNSNLEDVGENMDLPWDWVQISSLVTYEQFKKYEHDFPWSWVGFTTNIHMSTERVVREYIDMPWQWRLLSWNEKVVTLDMLRDFPNKPWDMFRVTQTYPWETIKQNLDISWDWDAVSIKDDIEIQDLEQLPDKPWDWSNLSWNENLVTLEMILEYPERDWNWYPISYNKFATWEVINDHNLSWDWYSISRWNRYITRDIIDQNQSSQWNYIGLSHSRYLSESDLEYLVDKFPNKTWCWLQISKKVSWDFIKTHLDLPWEWIILSDRSDITVWENVKETLDKPWDWNILSHYYDIACPKNVEKYPEIPWNYGVIIGLWTEQDRDDLIEKDNAAYKIQEWWRDILVEPYHPVGRRFIMKKILADVEAINERDGRDRRDGN